MAPYTPSAFSEKFLENGTSDVPLKFHYIIEVVRVAK